MKHLKVISVLSALMLAVGTLGFIACSQDEAEDTPTKAEILKAKAKEFAKKYGVEMSLNEENIEQIAETLTVEQMEKDFQAFAEFRGASSIDNQSTPRRTKGLKIKRAKTTEEEEKPIELDPYAGEREKVRGGNVKSTVNLIITRAGKKHHLSIGVDVSWHYDPRSSDKDKVTVNISEPSSLSVSTDISGYFYPGDIDQGDRVEAHGTITLTYPTYNAKFSFTFTHNSKTNETCVHIL